MFSCDPDTQPCARENSWQHTPQNSHPWLFTESRMRKLWLQKPAESKAHRVSTVSTMRQVFIVVLYNKLYNKLITLQ